MKVRINSNLYAKAFKEGWLTSLSYYVFLSSKFTNKKFNKKQALELMSEGAFNKQSVILNSKSLIQYDKKTNTYTLTSHKDVTRLYGGSMKLSTYQNNLHDLKQFLQLIPILSNLYTQQKAILRNKNSNTLLIKSTQAGEYFNFKKYQKAKKKGLIKIQNELRLSINGIMRLTGVKSRQKAIQLKKSLVKFGYAKSQRKIKILFKGVCNSGFKALLYNKQTPSYSKYDKVRNYVFIDDSTRFFLIEKKTQISFNPYLKDLSNKVLLNNSIDINK